MSDRRWGDGRPDQTNAPQSGGYAPAPQPMQPCGPPPQPYHPGYGPQGYQQQQQWYPPQQPQMMQQVVVVQQQPQYAAVYYKAPFNHTLHIILDIVTCGVWIPVHIIFALSY